MSFVKSRSCRFPYWLAFSLRNSSSQSTVICAWRAGRQRVATRVTLEKGVRKTRFVKNDISPARGLLLFGFTALNGIGSYTHESR